MRKRWFLVGMMFLLLPWLLAGCGIAQEVHDAVIAERDSLVANLQSVQSELDTAKSKLQSIQSELEGMGIELKSITGELDTAKSEVESTQSELTARESELQSVQSELETVKADLEAALVKLVEAEAPEVTLPQVTGQTYQNTKYGFSCDYPEGWTVDEGIDYAVLFAGSVEGKYDYLSNISIMVIELVVAQALEDFVSLSDIAAKSQFPSYTVVQQYETTLGGVPAIVQVCTVDAADAMGYPLKDAVATFMKGKTVYMITLDVTEDLYEKNRDKFILVTETFKFE